MASPPASHTSQSSPPPSNIPLPPKRPPLSLPPAQPSKRRKPSIASASSHPLRQTSFPPPDNPYRNQQRARAIFSPDDGQSATGRTSSIANGGYDDDQELDDDEVSAITAPSQLGRASIKGSTRGKGKTIRGGGSVRGGGSSKIKGAKSRGDATSVVSGSGRGKTDGDEEAAQPSDDDDEDKDGGEVMYALDGGKIGRERLEQDKERKAMFLSTLTSMSEDAGRLLPPGIDINGDDGQSRKRKLQRVAKDNVQQYELWNRIHLKKEVVRRLTNQTLSQSVPGSVVTAISAFSKVFAGEIIDRAYMVQIEWTRARLDAERHENRQKEADKTVDERNNDNENINDSDEKTYADVDERDLGPLLPDHLREALRRYKADREGGTVGFTGLSLEGRENTAIRNGGRRLFR